MAAPTTTDQWDEYLMQIANNDLSVVTSWNVGLYDDSTDTIAASDDISAITTEPSGSGYSTKSLTAGSANDATVAADGSDWVIDIDDQTWSSLTFSSQTDVDAFYMSFDVQLDGDGMATEHLMFVGTLSGGPYDLDNFTSFTAQDMGVKQTQS